MEWIVIAILAVVVIILAVNQAAQKRRFLKPIQGDFEDLYNFLGVKFKDGKLELTNGATSPFGGINTILNKIQAVLWELGFSIDSAGDAKIAEGGLVDRVKELRAMVWDSIIPYIGVTWDKDGKSVDAGYGLSKTLADLKEELDNTKNQLNLKAGYGDLNTLTDSVTALQKRLEYIRKSAGLLEDWEKLTEALEISEENAKTLVEKGYKDPTTIAAEKDEVKFLKSCGLDVDTASAVYGKVKGPKEQELVAP